MMIEDFGGLQAQVGELNKQAYVLDSRFRRIATERQQYRFDAEVANDMSEMQTKQAVLLRCIFDHMPKSVFTKK